MSSGNWDQVAVVESRDGNIQKPKIRYTREFLLSLQDKCKELPKGFDVSLLRCDFSLFEEAPSLTFERQRNSEGEYGLLSQSRLESLGGFRGNQGGRWDTRSSGSSDKEGDPQSARDSVGQDSGRRFGNQTGRNWQSSEHDGLLGSGAFPRPAGYTGASLPKGRGNGNYQLNRSTEPYQPPRPYKAMPYSKKDTDSFNDETFGSAECSSEDRAEAERKRRASFELMRKEQQKALQEKNKVNPDNHKENLNADLFSVLGNSVENGTRSGSKPDKLTSSHNDSMGSSLHMQAPASRPLVPPGFAGPLVEKNLPLQSSSNAFSQEGGNSLTENKHSLTSKACNQDKGKTAPVSVHPSLDASKVVSDLSIDSDEKILSDAKVMKQPIDLENRSSKITLPEVNEVWADDIIIMDDSSCKKGPAEIVNSAGQNNSTTILEKLFSSALPKNSSSTLISAEHQNVTADENTWTPEVFESSKFARWFSDEVKKSEEDPSSRNLLSLIVSNEKTSSQVSSTNKEVTESIPLSLDFASINTPPMLHSAPATSAAVLTCEEIEQSILAEVKVSQPSVNSSVQGSWIPSTTKSDKQKDVVDDQASQHLLSLLQKGMGMKESSSSQKSGFVESNERFSISHLHISDDPGVRNPEKVHSTEKPLTLETLFGSSFMNALHSAQAPVSAQRGSSSLEYVPNTSIHEREMSALNSAPRDNYGDVNIGEERTVEIQLPEEDSLITVGDTLNPLNSEPFQFENPHKPEFLPENSAVDLNDKFLNAMLRDGEEHLTRFPNGSAWLRKAPMEMVDPNNLYHHASSQFPHHHIDQLSSQFPHQHGQSSSQFPHHHTDQSRPLFPPSDQLAHRNPHHTFPGNMTPQIGYNNVGAPRFDPAVAHHPMLQHMQIPGNFPHHHSMQGLQRGVPISYPINHMPAHIPEMNSMNNFHLHNRQPSYGGGHGMGLPGPVIGGGGASHPEALERLFEMEMRAANSKQMHHPSMGGHIPGFYDHPQIDMNIRYR